MVMIVIVRWRSRCRRLCRLSCCVAAIEKISCLAFKIFVFPWIGLFCCRIIIVVVVNGRGPRIMLGCSTAHHCITSHTVASHTVAHHHAAAHRIAGHLWSGRGVRRVRRNGSRPAASWCSGCGPSFCWCGGCRPVVCGCGRSRPVVSRCCCSLFRSLLGSLLGSGPVILGRRSHHISHCWGCTSTGRAEWASESTTETTTKAAAEATAKATEAAKTTLAA